MTGMTDDLRALHEARGATFGEVAGRDVPLHYGDAAAEYRAVREGAGVADRRDRARIRMWGKDPARMLHGLVTNDVLKAAPGQGVYAAMLTPKGRMIAELRAFRRSDGELLVEIPREALAGTVDHLRKFVPPMFARWADATDEVGELGVYGPEAAALLGRVLGVEPPEGEDRFVEADFAGAPVLAAATGYVGVAGFDLFAPAAVLAALWTALVDGGARPVGLDTVDTLRIEAGRPRFGAELSAEVIPTEAYEELGMMPRAISFSKGCYTGQEVIVRIAHRGHVNRHLRGFLLPDGELPAAGTPLFNPDTGREIGKVTSAVFSPLRRGPVAIGFARREIEPGAEVRVGAADGAAATVVRLPFAREDGDA
jgi:folate-binding protein YgfZ